MGDKLKVYTNKTLSGELSKEEDKYIFNYLSDSKDLVSLTMMVLHVRPNGANNGKISSNCEVFRNSG